MHPGWHATSLDLPENWDTSKGTTHNITSSANLFESRNLVDLGHEWVSGVELVTTASNLSWGEVSLREWIYSTTTVLEHPGLLEAVSESRDLLKLKDDFDGEGSVAYSEETIDRAVEFVSSQATHFLLAFGRSMPIPEMLPGPDGSIDLHWKYQKFELLVNIPSDPRRPASFYGDDYGSAKIEGTFNPELPNRGLLSWLKEI